MDVRVFFCENLVHGGGLFIRKKTFDVVAIGATVCVIEKGKIAFLAEQNLLYWIDQGEQKEFSKLSLTEGQCVWLYVIKELSKVMSIVNCNGEKKEELLPANPVEVNVP